MSESTAPELTEVLAAPVCFVPLANGFGAEVSSSVRRLIGELTPADRAATVVVADLTELDTLPAPAVRVLTTIRRDCRESGIEMRVVASAPLRRVLEGVDAAWLGLVCPNVREAVQLPGRTERLVHLPVVEQAKGMLMFEFRLGPDEAFEVLRKLSRSGHGEVRDVATQLTERWNPAESGPSTGDVVHVVDAVRADLWPEQAARARRHG
jgi:anti-anti-sigma regulatory factor